MRNKIILVIGASSGIGRSVSLNLAYQGATVIISARNSEALHDLKMTIDNCGGSCHVYHCDIRLEESVQQLIDATIQQFGRIDIAILGSAIQYIDSICHLQVDEVDAMFQTNVIGIIRCTRYILPHMLSRQTGSIVLISSIMGDAAFPQMVSYGATKAAISCFARGLRREVSDTGIQVTLFSPGHMNTILSAHLHRRTPHWYGQSGSLEVNHVALKLIEAVHSKKDEVVVGRQSIMLSRIIKYFPYFANKIIRKITS